MTGLFILLALFIVMFMFGFIAWSANLMALKGYGKEWTFIVLAILIPIMPIVYILAPNHPNKNN